MEPTFVPLTGNAKLDHILTILGVVVTFASTVAGVLNGKIRAALDEGDPEDVPPLFYYLALLLNYCAFNVDKAVQIHKLMRGAAVKVMVVNQKPTDAGQP